MAFLRNALSANISKQYFWLFHEGGQGFKTWYYVTDDVQADVEESGYFNDAVDEVDVGDRIVVYQVGALSASRSTRDDVAAGLVTISEHIVLLNEGGVVDISPEIADLSVEYTLP